MLKLTMNENDVIIMSNNAILHIDGIFIDPISADISIAKDGEVTEYVVHRDDTFKIGTLDVNVISITRQLRGQLCIMLGFDGDRSVLISRHHNFQDNSHLVKTLNKFDDKAGLIQQLQLLVDYNG